MSCVSMTANDGDIPRESMRQCLIITNSFRTITPFISDYHAMIAALFRDRYALPAKNELGAQWRRAVA